MVQFEYVIQDELGIHARPAGLLAKTARPFACRITLSSNGHEADVRRLFSVMQLAVKKGQTVTFTLDGEDEAQAAEALRCFCEDTL